MFVLAIAEAYIPIESVVRLLNVYFGLQSMNWLQSSHSGLGR